MCHPPAVQAFSLGKRQRQCSAVACGVKGFALATRAHPAALLDNVEDLEAGTASLRLYGALPHTLTQFQCQLLSPWVVVPLKHFQFFVPGDSRQFQHIRQLASQPRRTFMPKVVEVEIF